jgi:alpha-1,3-rhamnosyl/mannosyltransferase
MRVVVNQLPAVGLKTGVGHYTVELLRCLRQQAAADDRIDVFPRGWMARARRLWSRMRPGLEPPGTEVQPGWPAPRSLLSALRSQVIGALRWCGHQLMARHARAVFFRGQYDLYHEPNFIPLPADLPTVATLHDLSALLHPEWHPADRVAWYERYFPDALRRCVHFLTVSEFTRQEVIRHLGVPPGRVTRVYNGIRPGLKPLPEETVAPVLRRLGLPPRYLLCLGTIEPRKNVLTLLRAYCALPPALRERWPLVLAGAWGWNTGAVADYFHAEARHRGVRHLGYVADKYLAAVYNGARALVYPSYYEGFGLPPLEMMACGGAVLASTADALVETVGGQAHLTEAEDIEGWRRAIGRVLTDDDWWQLLRFGAVAKARPYTWDRCAAETLAVYRTVTARSADAARKSRAA